MWRHVVRDIAYYLTLLVNIESMKLLLFVVTIVSCLTPELLAQVAADSVTRVNADSARREYGDEILTFVETEPTPVDGYEAFYHYIGMNIKYPQKARNGRITGKVIVEFVVEKNGVISPNNIKILKSPHQSLSDEAIRLIKTGPKWIPGKQQGIPVRTKKVFPITFKLG
jgi:TonB family protein